MGEFSRNEIDLILNELLPLYETQVEKVRLPPKSERRTKQVKEEIIVQKQVEVDAGPDIHGFAAIGLGVVLGVVLGIFVHIAAGIGAALALGGAGAWMLKKYRKTKTEQVEEPEFREVTKEVDMKVDAGYEDRIITSPFRLKAMGRVSIPFFSYPLPSGKSILCPPSGVSQTEQLPFPLLNRHSDFSGVEKYMEKNLSRIPYILKGESKPVSTSAAMSSGKSIRLTGYEKELTDAFETAEEIFSDKTNSDLIVPFFANAGISSFLVLKEDRLDDDSPFAMLDSYLNSAEGYQLEEAIRKWLTVWSRNKDVLSLARFESLDSGISEITSAFGSNMRYASFNFYCPRCNKDDVDTIMGRDYTVHAEMKFEPVYFSKNTRCVYDPANQLWECKVCGFKTGKPIPIHKSFDEVLAPAYDRLMDEHQVDRLKAHSEIREREHETENKMEEEVERFSYEHLSSLFSLTDEMERIKADIEGEGDAVEALNQAVAHYGDVQSAIIDDVNTYQRTIDNQVKERTRMVIQEVEKIKTKEMAKLNEEMLNLSKARRYEDEMRDKIQFEILSSTRDFITLAGDSNGAAESSAPAGNDIGGSIEAAISRKDGVRLYGESIREAEEQIRSAIAALKGKPDTAPQTEGETDDA